MSYRHLPPQQYQPYVLRQCFYDNNRHDNIVEEQSEAAYFDAVNFSESDGYIDIPMVRPVPSHEIQELFRGKPMLSSSVMSTTTSPQHVKHYFGDHGEIADMCVYDMNPRPPSRPPSRYQVAQTVSGMNHQAIPHRSSLNQPDIVRPVSTRSRIQHRDSNSFSSEGFPFTNSTVPIVGNVSTNPEMPQRIKRFPVKSKQTRLIRRPLVKASSNNYNVSSCQRSNETAAANSNQKLPTTNKPSSSLTPGVSKSQEISRVVTGDETRPDSLIKCTTRPDTSSGLTKKKMNSMGDATTVDIIHDDADDSKNDTKLDDLDKADSIKRMASSIDVKEVEELNSEQKNEIKEISKYLMPKVPSSLKSKQVSSGSHSRTSLENVNNVSLKQSLNNILDQLENCEMSLNAVKAKYSKTKIDHKDEENECCDKIFNYKELTVKLSNNECVKNSPVELQEDVPASEQERPQSALSEKMIALELHRSKSYIVNLIDRALSRELGTMPKERNKRNQDLETLRAINKIKMDRSFGPEVDTRIIRSEGDNDQAFITNAEEPAYIKQLKELRWGHFKHIQEEVQRLEDLERFLDTCSSSTSTFSSFL